MTKSSKVKPGSIEPANTVQPGQRYLLEGLIEATRTRRYDFDAGSTFSDTVTSGSSAGLWLATFEYDPANLALHEVSVSGSGGSLLNFSYTYDDAGQVQDLVGSVAGCRQRKLDPGRARSASSR
jgi:hypothetical protein